MSSIGKAKAIAHGKALTEYAERKGFELDAQNAISHSPSEVIQEMREQQQLHKGSISKPFLSVVFAPESTADYKDKDGKDMDMKSLVREYLKKLCSKLTTNSGKAINFSELQYKAWQHDEMSERKIAHGHILVNRVLGNGEVISDSWIGLKAKQAANEIDKKHALKDAEQLGKELKSTMKQRAFDALREAANGQKRGTIDKEIKANPVKALRKYALFARQYGLELRLSRSSTGRVSGYYLQLDESYDNGYHHAYKASDIDRNLTLSRIGKTFDKIVIEEEKRKQEEVRKAEQARKQEEEKKKQEEETKKKQEEKKDERKPERQQKPRWHRGL